VSGRRSDFGNTRKLPSGRWQARYNDRGGRVRTAGRTFPTRTDARRYLAEVRTDMSRGEWFDPSAGRFTFAEFSVLWIASRRVKGRPLAPRTKELYRWQLDKHLLPTLGSIELRHLDAPTVRAWHIEMSEAAGPGAVTTAKCYRLLRAICNSAVRDAEIARSPCTISGAGIEASPERPSVSVPEVMGLADAVGDRWRTLILLAAFCGLRFGELAALTRSAIDPLHGTIDVRETAADLRGGARDIRAPKGAGRRTVAIPPHILSEVRTHIDSYALPGPQGLVFNGPNEGRLRNANFGRSVWRPAVRSLGLQGLHFHDLRGCAATLAAISGATTAELMRRLGHSTPNMALRYQRATADRDAAVARAMSDLVSGASVTPLSHVVRRSTQSD
jgi:integrase